MAANQAAAVNYTFDGETGGLVIKLHTLISGYENVYAEVGQFKMTTTDAGWLDPLYTYCTDVGVILANSHEYTPLAFSDPASQGVNPAWISGGIQNAARLWYNYKDTALSDVQTAGLQLAIWEALYNSSFSHAGFFSSANAGFYIESADSGDIGSAVDYAVGLLNNLGSLPGAPDGTWLAPINQDGSIGGSQGLFYPAPDTGSSLLLLTIAMLGILTWNARPERG